jgi:hypothetical protein
MQLQREVQCGVIRIQTPSATTLTIVVAFTYYYKIIILR